LRGSILDEMRLKRRLDSKNLDIAIARPIAAMNSAVALRRFAPIQTRNSRGLI
jgi:hypothetical protein